MSEVSNEALQDAIRNLHGCESLWVAAVPVTETFQGRTVWDGEVQAWAFVAHRLLRRRSRREPYIPVKLGHYPGVLV